MDTLTLAIGLVSIIIGGLDMPDMDLVHGVATYYPEAKYSGKPLYAGGTYDPASGIRWCAVDVREFESGRIQSGDLLLVRFANTPISVIYEAWDAGPFEGYKVIDYPGLPIVLDIPQHLWPFKGNITSQEVYVVNLSQMGREWLGDG